MATEQDTFHETELQRKVKEQLQVVQAALSKLDKEQEVMEHERKAMDHKIQSRYAGVLHHLEDAREECLLSLREEAQVAQDKLESERMAAQMLLNNLSRVKDKCQREMSSGEAPLPQHGLLSDAVFRHYQQLASKTQDKMFFSYSPDGSIPQDLSSLVHQLMGTVSPFEQLRTLPPKSNSSPEGVPNTELLTIVSALQADIWKIHQDLTVAQRENRNLAQKVSSIERNIGSELSTAEKPSSAVPNRLTALQGEVCKLQMEMAAIHKMIDKPRPAVAFHAELNTNVHAVTRTVLILSKVTTNIGGGYDSTTGTFTAPVAGTYLFLANANQLCKGMATRFTFCVNGAQRGMMRSGDYNSCSGFLLENLTAGDAVQMVAAPDSHEVSFCSEGLTYFCGLLLHSDT